MTRQADIIALAEFVGWKHEMGGGRDWYHPTDRRSRCFVNQLPNPFEDANDDYAILEKMRDSFTISQRYESLDANVQNYRIGDYARAAHKALKEGE